MQDTLQDTFQDTLKNVPMAENQEPRIPSSIVVDRSGSMVQEGRIETLNSALAQFKADVEEDTLASFRADVSLVAFNDRVETVDFCSIREFNPPLLSAAGGTKISLGVHTALDLLERRKREYDANGISRYRAIAVLITDGRAEHDTAGELAQVRARIADEEAERRIAFFSFGIGEADMDELMRIAPPNRPPRYVGDARGIAMILKALSESLQIISTSSPGEPVSLDPFERLERYGSY